MPLKHWMRTDVNTNSEISPVVLVNGILRGIEVFGFNLLR